MHVGSLRAGDVRIRKAMQVVAVASEGVQAIAGGGGGEWRHVEVLTRPQPRCGVILGDEAPARHGLPTTYNENGSERPLEFEKSAA